ncbi:MATE family efflux transporter [Romboutsia lituseburensis]|uniref:MATE family efflux transporter n=1 Tax=Romboutsia lituseburensis TaxID=1537 RepID=UPI002ED119CA
MSLTPFFMELAAGSIHLVTNRVLKIYGGDLAIGAMTTITSIYLIFLMPVFGMSQGMQTIIAYNYGAKEYEHIKKALIIFLISGTTILIFGFIIIRLFPQELIGIFTNNSELLELAIDGIKIYTFALPAIGISILGSMYFQSIGSAKISMLLSLLRQVIILIPVISIVPKLYGLNGVWAAQPIADLGAMTIVCIFLINEFKKDK